METYTIQQKQSNSGTIHDIESDLVDRDIKFYKGTQYAVVLSSYYDANLYTTHKTEATAIRQSQRLNKEGYSHEIIDVYGSRYTSDGVELFLQD